MFGSEPDCIRDDCKRIQEDAIEFVESAGATEWTVVLASECAFSSNMRLFVATDWTSWPSSETVSILSSTKSSSLHIVMTDTVEANRFAFNGSLPWIVELEARSWK